MTGTAAQHTWGTKQLPRGNGVRGRTQQRKARGRFPAHGGCGATFATNCTAPVLPTEEITGGSAMKPMSPAANATTNFTEIVTASFTANEMGEDAPQPHDPLTLAKSPEQCNAIIAKLESGSSADISALVLQIHKRTRQLALSKHGCRVIQKAFDVAGGSNRDLMIAELKDHVTELYESPHGNHVLSRAIEVLPVAKNGFVISALSGRTIMVSKHQYGCRVVCRLVEHCSEDEIGELLDEVVSEAASLARHPYGNFVVQAALEHTTHARRSAMLSQLLPDFGGLSTLRIGSLVSQRILDYCDEAGQNLAIQTLIQGECGVSIVEVACSRYGSYVIEQLAGMRHALVEEVARILACNTQRLHDSEFGLRVVAAFGFAHSEAAPRVE